MQNHEADDAKSGRLLYELASACSSCASEAQFAALTRNLARQLIPSASLIAIIGRIDLDHLELLRIAPVDYPMEALSCIRQTGNLRDRKAIVSWLRSREPFLIQLPQDSELLSPLEAHEIRSFGLGRIGAHGVLDLVAQSGSYFSFGGIPEDLPAATIVQRLKLVVPHLHQALLAIHRASPRRAGSTQALTFVERDLIRWIAAGRTNVEIAQIRGRSLATVRNQITALFRKMGVHNRAEAVRTHRLN